MIFKQQSGTLLQKTSSYLTLYGSLGLLLLSQSHSGEIEQTSQNHEDSFRSTNGQITVSQVMQMSVVINTPSGVIYTDPTRGKQRYSGHPSPDLILISHEHHEHFDVDTLEQIAELDTRIIVPTYVMQRLPAKLAKKAVSLKYGETYTLGAIKLEAVAAYGLNGQSARWHPYGRGNGYVVTVDGIRMYIAGSTDATPEMLQLQDINVAFFPLYPPYAMGVDNAVLAVSTIKPQITYIYQYNSTQTRDAFISKLNESETTTKVIARDIK